MGLGPWMKGFIGSEGGNGGHKTGRWGGTQSSGPQTQRCPPHLRVCPTSLGPPPPPPLCPLCVLFLQMKVTDLGPWMKSFIGPEGSNDDHKMGGGTKLWGRRVPISPPPLCFGVASPRHPQFVLGSHPQCPQMCPQGFGISHPQHMSGCVPEFSRYPPGFWGSHPHIPTCTP